MDGDKHSYVMLALEEDSDEMMVVGGGENNKYICMYYDGDEYSLINPSEKSDAKVEVLMGQMSIRKKYEIIDLESVLLAVKTYAESGEMEKSLTWKKL